MTRERSRNLIRGIVLAPPKKGVQIDYQFQCTIYLKALCSCRY